MSLTQEKLKVHWKEHSSNNKKDKIYLLLSGKIELPVRTFRWQVLVEPPLPVINEQIVVAAPKHFSTQRTRPYRPPQTEKL